MHTASRRCTPAPCTPPYPPAHTPPPSEPTCTEHQGGLALRRGSRRQRSWPCYRGKNAHILCVCVGGGVPLLVPGWGGGGSVNHSCRGHAPRLVFQDRKKKCCIGFFFSFFSLCSVEEREARGRESPCDRWPVAKPLVGSLRPVESSEHTQGPLHFRRHPWRRLPGHTHTHKHARTTPGLAAFPGSLRVSAPPGLRAPATPGHAVECPAML